MSTARFNTLENAAGSKSVPVATVVDGSAKAWVNFNGTGTVAIRASFNVSSVTDNSTGDYTINFTTAMVDQQYAVNVSGDGPVYSTVGHCQAYVAYPGVRSTYTTSAVAVAWFYPTDSAFRADPSIALVSVFR